MRIYYAHSMGLYGTKQEERDIVLLESLGFDVLNPGMSEHVEGCIAYSKSYGRQLERQDGPRLRMEYFKVLVAECNVLAFRALSDGSIPAGVMTEIRVAKDKGMAIIELPSGLARRALSVEATIEHLRESGER